MDEMNVKKWIGLFVVAVVVAGSVGAAETTEFTITGNPIFRDAFTADPATMVDGDTLYAYVGHDNAKGGQFFTMPDWRCYSTKDMKTWTSHGSIMRPEEFKFARPDVAWAAQMNE
jgi:arabinoxylan arabinofuranohydrolase